jgi:hypothetical protein
VVPGEEGGAVLALKQWQRLACWSERLPLWAQVTLVPPVAPAVLGVAGACLCPRTAALAGGVLTAVYGFLLWTGLIGWGEIGRTLGGMYLLFVAAAYLGVLQHLSERLFARLVGTQTGGPGGESREAPPGS